MKTDSEVTILNKVAERILDPANGKPSQTQCRAMANEHVCEFLIGSMIAAQISRGNSRSSERQHRQRQCRLIAG